MEKSNPFICISEVSIISQPNNPENHLFGFVAEWPSWSTEKVDKKVSMR